MAARKKVLIAEDESITAMSMVDLIEFWGYETCEPASSAEEALRRAEAERPDLAILDIKLRGETSGIELAEKLMERFGMPVIFISGYDNPWIKKQAEKAGAAGFLAKPFDLVELKAALDRLLS